MTAAEAENAMNIARKKYSNKYSPQNINVYQYWAQINKIVDGDTYDLNISMGFNTSINERFRLLGIDTPETYGVKKNSTEYKKGKAATDFVKTIIKAKDWIEVSVYFGRKEKYGRWLCEIFKDGISLNEQLLVNAHAKVSLY